MRRFAYPFLTGLLLGLTACTQSGPTALTPELAGGSASLGAVTTVGLLAESAMAIYTLELDPAALQATVSLQETRAGQANDDLYALPISSFLGAEDFRVDRVRRTATTIDLDWTLRHPFPAPANPTGTPNGRTNRADLGVAGRVLFLSDVATSTGNTYFSNRIANTALVRNADAYWSPAGLLGLTTNANLFPYQTLVDESTATGSRVGISNGGSPTGNFGADGWTRAEFGPTNDGWTGYGVLHQGQASSRTLQLDLAAIQAGNTFTMDVAIIAKYNDPRGGRTGIEKRGNRLPPASPDANLFAYRMPHGALDVERITLINQTGGFLPNAISAETFSFRVIDWDARAVETTEQDLAEDMDVTTVAPGESGVPSLAVCIPGVLGDSSTVDLWDAGTLLDDDSLYGGDVDPDSGHPGDALFFEKSVTKMVTSGQTPGTYTGMVRATDVETQLAGGLVIALDANLQPVTTNLPVPVTYQAFRVDMNSIPNEPPSATVVVTSPQVATGGVVAVTVSSLADPDGDDVTLSFDWDDDGTPDFTTAPIAVPNAGPLAFDSGTHGGMTFTFSPPAPDYRTLAVSISDGALSVDVTPALGVNNEHFEVLEFIPGWVRSYGSNTGTSRFWDVVVDSSGNAYAAGFYAGTANFGSGPITAAGSADLLVVKLDAYGTQQWYWTVTSSGMDEIQAITIDPVGNSYITGAFGGTINFTGTPRTFGGGTGGDAFLVKLSPSGVPVWDKVWSSGGDDRGWGIGTNAAGSEIAFTGKLAYSADFGGGSRPLQRRFVVKYDTNGTYLWDPVWNVEQGINIYGDVAFDSTNAIVVAGHTRNTPDFGFGVQPEKLDDDAFIMKWSATGVPQWVNMYGGSDTEVGAAIAIDSTDAIILAGKSFGDGNYGSTTAPDDHQFCVKVNSAGSYQWDWWFMSGGATWGVAVDSANNVLVAGGYSGPANFGGGPRTSPGSFGSFLCKRSSAGTYLWDATWGFGTGVDYTFGVGVAPDGSARVAGQFDGTEDFEPGPGVTSQSTPGSGIYHGFVSRINSNGLW